jgi:hypothetical protein
LLDYLLNQPSKKIFLFGKNLFQVQLLALFFFRVIDVLSLPLRGSG